MCHVIIKKTDGSTGGGSDDSIFRARRDMSNNNNRTGMRRIVKMKERGAKEVIPRMAEERMTPTTSVVIVEVEQA
jgi:hypothetical protein